MQKEFIPYDRALKLKALGFDEPNSLGFHILNPTDLRGKLVRLWSEYGKGNKISCNAITYRSSFRWFREKYGLYSTIDGLEMRQYYKIIQTNEYSKEFSTYEEAELACLDKLIEIVENK